MHVQKFACVRMCVCSCARSHALFLCMHMYVFSHVLRIQAVVRPRFYAHTDVRTHAHEQMHGVSTCAYVRMGGMCVLMRARRSDHTGR